jgi:hypothetical protein
LLESCNRHMVNEWNITLESLYYTDLFTVYFFVIILWPK